MGGKFHRTTVLSSLPVRIWSESGEKQHSEMGSLCICVRAVKADGSLMKFSSLLDAMSLLRAVLLLRPDLSINEARKTWLVFCRKVNIMPVQGNGKLLCSVDAFGFLVPVRIASGRLVARARIWVPQHVATGRAISVSCCAVLSLLSSKNCQKLGSRP